MLFMPTLKSSFARGDLVKVRNYYGYCRIIDVRIFRNAKVEDEVFILKYLCTNSKESFWVLKSDIIEKVGEIHGICS